MKRRICLVGTAIAVVPFAVGISVATAAGKSTTRRLKGRNTELSTFGFRVEKATFKVPDSGDTVGQYVQYFGGGSIRGKFDLSPDQAGDIADFTSDSWTGTVTVIKGTRTLAKQGVLKCRSGDSVHLTCTEKLTLKQL